MVLNTLLFIPLGVALGPANLATAGLVGAVLSVGAESYQVFCHGRFPSATDVWWNIIGCMLGALVYRGLSRGSSLRLRERP
jgi:glycopeptide antibiotics resistance protein